MQPSTEAVLATGFLFLLISMGLRSIVHCENAKSTIHHEHRKQKPNTAKKKILTYNYSILGGMKKDANTWKASKSSSDISWRCCFSVFITEMFLQREKRMELFAILGVSQ